MNQLSLEKFLRAAFPETDKLSPDMVGFLSSIYVHLTGDSLEENTLREIYHHMPDELRQELVRSLAEAGSMPKSFHVDHWAYLVWGNPSVRSFLVRFLSNRPGYEKIERVRMEIVEAERRKYLVFLNPTPIHLLGYAVKKTGTRLYLASSSRHGAIAQIIIGSHNQPMFPIWVLDDLAKKFPGGLRPRESTLIWNPQSLGIPGIPTVDEMFDHIRRRLHGGPHPFSG